MFVFKRAVSNGERGCRDRKMSRCNQEIVYEGWLTKSPPSKRIWKAKWRRRWFVLRHSGELPGQYFLDYYSDPAYNKLKGSVDLDLCEQVDAGLCMDVGNGSRNNPLLKGSVFSVRTQGRVYHFVAECISEMENWVDAICRVCGLRVAEDETTHSQSGNGNRTEQNNAIAMTDISGPYIPISECITGPPICQQPRSAKAFTFESNDVCETSLLHNAKESLTNRQQGPKMNNTKPNPIYHNENLSVFVDRELKVPISTDKLNGKGKSGPSTSFAEKNVEWKAAKSFTRLAVNPKPYQQNEHYVNTASPKPPRPNVAKPAHLSHANEVTVPKETFAGRPMNEPVEFIPPFISPQERNSFASAETTYETPHNIKYTNATIPTAVNEKILHTEETPTSKMYVNWTPFQPPEVDRNLKPSKFRPNNQKYEMSHDPRANRTAASHAKSRSALETRTIYNTVDFIKTEALILTRMDMEASRKRSLPK